MPVKATGLLDNSIQGIIVSSIVIVCVAIYLSTYSAKTLASGADDLAQLLSASRYFQAAFKQQVRDSEGELIDQSQGKMLLSRPDKLRWDIDEPLEQTIVVNSGQYFQYDRDIDQLIIETLSDQLSAMPSLLLSGNAEAISAEFKVEQVKAITSASGAGTAPPLQLFKLKPLAEQGLFRVLTLEFSGGILQAIGILDDLEQTSRFEFSEIDNVTPIDKDQFELNPPADTDIIRR